MEVSVIQSNIPEPVVKISDRDRREKWWHKCLAWILPSRQEINRYIAKFFIGLFICAMLYGMLGENAEPGSEVFALFVIIVFSILGGKLIHFLNLPPLVGMLIVGFIFRNVHAIPYYNHINKTTIWIIRECALSIILLRAGLGLNREALMKLKTVVVRLTIIPCLTEAISMGIIGHFLLDVPFIFSFMLGFIISAISPEVVLPPLLMLEKQKYGVQKGIPALVIGATSLDDILAIAGFSICFSIAFSTKSLTWTLVKAPLEPVMGFLFSVVFGILFWRYPAPETQKGLLAYYHVLMVYSASLAAMFFTTRIHIAGAGPLTCIILAFVAAIKWRENIECFNIVDDTFVVMWLIAEPVLFSLIGAEITVEVLKDNAGYAILSLFCALTFRTIATASVIYGARLNCKEKIFICCSYLPKASVQAAIGSQALDYARAHDKPDKYLDYGITVLNVCVLSLLLTAPIASILINLLGPVLLTRDTEPLQNEDHSPDPDHEHATIDGKKLVSDYSFVKLLQQNDQDNEETENIHKTK